MLLSKHIRLLLFVTFGWALFVLIGWPSYYQHWSLNWLLYFCCAVYLFLGIYIYAKLKHYDGNRLIYGLWLAFYISVPLFFYDYLYINLILFQPFDLLNRFWFLSVFHIIPWYQALLSYLYMKTQISSGKVWFGLGSVFLILAILLKSQWAIFDTGFFDTEGSVSMLEAALRYSIYGTLLSSSFLSFLRLFSRTNQGRGTFPNRLFQPFGQHILRDRDRGDRFLVPLQRCK